jgi:propanol-preferring alcohol dehydrogenase
MDAMRAAVLEEFGKPLVLGERERPEPGPGETLIRVEACGVCHSDVHLADGDWEALSRAVKLPLIPGHEVAGVEVATGARVGVPWLGWSCGECEYCGGGRETLCLKQRITGVMADGGYAEYMTVAASHAIAIPGGLSAVEAAPLFCAGVTAYKALKSSGLAEGGRVAVFGVGGLGHLAVQIAREMGAVVCGVDVEEPKLALARECGAQEAIPAGEEKALRKWAPEVAVVTAASVAAYRSALRSLKRGGTLMVVGMPKEDLSLAVVPLVGGEIRVMGSAVGTRADCREMLSLAAERGVRCRVEAHPLEAVNGLFERLRRGGVAGRAVLTF